MATLTIRNVPDDLRDKLRIRAARNGRSMEAEARAALARAVSPVEGTLHRADRLRRAQDTVTKYIQPGSYSVDEFLAEKRRDVMAEEERWRRLERETAQARDTENRSNNG